MICINVPGTGTFSVALLLQPRSEWIKEAPDKNHKITHKCLYSKGGESEKKNYKSMSMIYFTFNRLVIKFVLLHKSV